MESKGISKLDLKRRNRKQILNVMREFGPISRVDIASELQLTRAAVTIITNDMIEQGVLFELGEAPIDENNLKKGRRKILLEVNPNYKFVLGTMINEDNISVGLSNLAGEVLDKDFMTIGDEIDQQEIIAFIAKSCQRMMKDCGLTEKQILGMGVGIVPARWSQMRAEVKNDVPDFSKLRYILELEVNVPVHCGNAIALYAMANLDHRQGSHQNQLLIYNGQQYNLAVISDNVLLRRCILRTENIGRVVIKPGGAKAKGYPDGSVHAELSHPAILAQLRERFSADRTPILYQLCDGDIEQCSIEKANVAYTEGDPGVSEILEQKLMLIAYLLHNMMLTQFADHAVLQNYIFCEKSRTRLHSYLKVISGAEMADRVVYSDLDAERSFLAGCNYATEEMFYALGGLA